MQMSRKRRPWLSAGLLLGVVILLWAAAQSAKSATTETHGTTCQVVHKALSGHWHGVCLMSQPKSWHITFRAQDTYIVSLSLKCGKNPALRIQPTAYVGTHALTVDPNHYPTAYQRMITSPACTLTADFHSWRGPDVGLLGFITVNGWMATNIYN